jgi:biotin carboxyl carrier protein
VKTQYHVRVNGEDQLLTLTSEDERHYTVRLGEQCVEFVVDETGPRNYQLRQGDHLRDLLVSGALPEFRVYDRDGSVAVQLMDEKQAARQAISHLATGDASGTITAPMPGKVVRCIVAEGESVKVGDGVVVVEAMKMENELRSPVDGVVKKVYVGEGEAVEANQQLILIE